MLIKWGLLLLIIGILVFDGVLSQQPTRKEEILYLKQITVDFIQNMTVWKQSDNARKFFKEDSSEDITHFGDFDFIIVGAGSSGSVLANRLTESGKFKVLVLEAGGPENDVTDIPAFAGYLMRSDFNWGHRTVPQTTCCLGMQEKRCNYPRGKAIGGSSVINYMFYSRGNKEDYDTWAAAGNPGWDYQSVLPYFKKSEKSTLSMEDAEYHGHDGLLNVEQIRYNASFSDRFLDAAVDLGYKIIDYNGKEQIGFAHHQSTTINGKRCSAGKAFIKPALGRQNLQLLDRSFVTKVLIENNKAYGVEFLKDGKKYSAKCSKEVILSAGAINTPQLLMISGIGPKEHLDELGVPLIKDLPVGKVLLDHQLYFGLQFATNITLATTNVTKIMDNYLDGFGPFTAASSATGIGFTNNRIKSKTNPNVEFIFITASAEQIYIFSLKSLETTKENWTPIYKPAKGLYCWMIIPILLHPESKGSLKLKSKDPFEFPLIDFNMLSDPGNVDLEDMLNAVKESFKMADTRFFKELDSKYVSDPVPGCKQFEHLSDDYWRCAIRHFTTTVYHPMATCKMGPENDNMAVVNSKLKLYGIESLRVIDASVIPLTTASHTNAVCYMIAEKGADIIREEYQDEM